MNWKISTRLALAGLCCLTALGVTRWSAPPVQKASKITLTMRTDNGGYGRSAYSFRYASQDPDEHLNRVDLILNACGNVHISGGGARNRIALSTEKKLSKVQSLPEEGWLESCFTPTKSAIYVLQIEDDQQKWNVKLRILDVKQDKVVFEWLPLVVPAEMEIGTLGQCGGAHTCS